MENFALPQIHTITLSNPNGMRFSVINRGGRITELWVPDRLGNLADVVLGYDSATQYINGNPYFGALIGRCANRIAGARFELDGLHYWLPANNGPNSLHGGVNGFHHAMWDMALDSAANRVVLRYLSADGEEGYPGNLRTEVSYQLTHRNELIIEYTATTDAPTLVNLTHHSFFNLAGEGDILDHVLQIYADRFLPVDETLIPTGELAGVANSPFDFRAPARIAERISQAHEQLERGRGYDHNWVLNRAHDGTLQPAARVTEPRSGRVMEVLTTEPGLQFYSGNFLDGRDVGKRGQSYAFRSAFCLEAQRFPNAPNHPHFPSVVLRPGETYRQTTIYRFGVEP
jgi:aldose 1-epimerase